MFLYWDFTTNAICWVKFLDLHLTAVLPFLMSVMWQSSLPCVCLYPPSVRGTSCSKFYSNSQTLVSLSVVIFLSRVLYHLSLKWTSCNKLDSSTQTLVSVVIFCQEYCITPLWGGYQGDSNSQTQDRLRPIFKLEKVMSWNIKHKTYYILWHVMSWNINDQFL